MLPGRISTSWCMRKRFKLGSTSSVSRHISLAAEPPISRLALPRDKQLRLHII